MRKAVTDRLEESQANAWLSFVLGVTHNAAPGGVGSAVVARLTDTRMPAPPSPVSAE